MNFYLKGTSFFIFFLSKLKITLDIDIIKKNNFFRKMKKLTRLPKAFSSIVRNKNHMNTIVFIDNWLSLKPKVVNRQLQKKSCNLKIFIMIINQLNRYFN